MRNVIPINRFYKSDSTIYNESLHQDALRLVHLPSHQQPHRKRNLPANAQRLLQHEIPLPVCRGMQKCLQDVPVSPPHPVIAVQEEKTQAEVPLSLPSPLAELKKFLKGFVKSMLFAGGYSMLIRRTVCFVTTHVQFTHCTPSDIQGAR